MALDTVEMQSISAMFAVVKLSGHFVLDPIDCCCADCIVLPETKAIPLLPREILNRLTRYQKRMQRGKVLCWRIQKFILNCPLLRLTYKTETRDLLSHGVVIINLSWVCPRTIGLTGSTSMTQLIYNPWTEQKKTKDHFLKMIIFSKGRSCPLFSIKRRLE